MSRVNYCRHIKEDGVPCGSPPLRGENYCHFHLRYKGHRIRTGNKQHCLGGFRITRGTAFNLKALQAGLKRVERMLASGRCPDPERARAIHYALQIAISNLRYTEAQGENWASVSGSAKGNKSNKRSILR